MADKDNSGIPSLSDHHYFTFFKEFDQWFFDMASTSAKQRWYEGYKYLLQQVPQEWINKDIHGAPTGIKGMWSKWHNLGPVTNTIKEIL
mgnify:CR=1 FL=1